MEAAAQPGPGQQWVALARLTRAWGNRGALLAESLGRGVQDFGPEQVVWLCGAGSEPRPAAIEWVRAHRGRLLFKFRGVESIAAAEELAGWEVRVPMSQRRELPPGEYYQTDLVGCQVVDAGSGRTLGVVAGWQDYGAAPLMEVDAGAPGEALLVPFARSICVEVDLAARRIVVALPDGLKELSG